MNLRAKKHKGPIQDVLNFKLIQTLTDEKVETIFAHSLAPWVPPLGSLHNLNISKEEAIEAVEPQLTEETNNNAIILFTDGSFSPEGGGAAAVSATHSSQLTINQKCRFSNHETELLGIKLAAQLILKLLRDQSPHSLDVAVFCDNQGVLKLIHDTPQASSGQHLVISIRSIFRTLPPDLKLRIYWSPGHAGIELNKREDELAKEAAQNREDCISLPSSLGSLKQEINKAFNVKWLILKPGKNRY